MESNGNDLSSESDLDETALEEAKNAQKVRNSSLNDENLDCSMKSDIGQSWDVSAIIKSEDKSTRKNGPAESTHIQSLMHSQFQSSGTENEGRLDAIKDDENVDVNIDDDVCMDSVYGDSRGFRFVRMLKGSFVTSILVLRQARRFSKTIQQVAKAKVKVSTLDSAPTPIKHQEARSNSCLFRLLLSLLTL